MGRTTAHQRLKAATLLESVLAMGLVAAAMSFAIGMHARILGADRSADRMQAWAVSERMIAERMNGADGDTPVVNGLEVEVEETGVAPGILRIDITCSRNGRQVLSRSCIIAEPS